MGEGARAKEPAQELEGSGLPRTVWAEQRNVLIFSYLQREVVEGQKVVVVLAQPLDDDGFVHGLAIRLYI